MNNKRKYKKKMKFFKNSIIDDNVLNYFFIKPIIKKKEFLIKSKCCERCQKRDLSDNEALYHLGRDISFDCYYWIKSKISDNQYSFCHSICTLNNIFKSQIFSLDLSSDGMILNCENIALSDLIELCTYHSVWLHYYYHFDKAIIMTEFDKMEQGDHVKHKNLLNILIFFKLKNPKRLELLKEISEFNLVPPIKSNGICGYEYKMAKFRFENKSYS